MNISFLKEKKSKYLVFILLGLLILVMCIPTGTNSKISEKEEVSETQGSLQSQLEQVLSAMEGVGKVKVMITMAGESDSVFGTSKGTQKVSGVVVVAEGAGSASVNARISDVVKALFSIDVNKISIVKMRSQEEQR